jgi:hypothetical protein
MMKNMDLLNKQKAEIMVKMNKAMTEGNEEEFSQAFTEYTDMLQEAVMAEAKGLVEATDNQILTGRGVRVLTSEEKQYYDKIISAMRSGNPKQELTLIDETLPKTVINAVFEDIVENHPLLNAINFQNTGILVEILVSKLDGRFLSHWGKLCDEITKELSSGFEVINLKHAKLSAYIPVCKAMLEIGPEWIDRYVRTILAEAIANGLEKALIDGSGIDEPVGMRRNPAGSLDPTDGYPELIPVPITEITPETYGGLIAELATGLKGLVRPVTEVLLVVNPIDYFTKLLPSTTEKVNGAWVNNIFPFPTRVTQSVWVPENEMIIGLAKRYFFGLGTGKEGKIEYSDHYHFLEDERVYLTKLYGNGKPLDNKSFMIIDITDLKPAYPIVRVTDYVDARLSGIDLIDELTAEVNYGTFNENIHYYTAEVADDTTTGDNDTLDLEATAKDETAILTVTLNGDTVDESEGVYSLELTEGQNVIVITSTVGAESEAYVIVVDYTPVA